MNEIKKAIRDRLLGDDPLVALLNSDTAVYYRRPRTEVETPVITYSFISRTPDWDIDEYGKIEILLQIDIWSKSEDTNDLILKEVDRVLYQWRTTTASWDIKRFLRRGDRAMPKDEGGITQLSTDWLVTAYKKP